MSKRDGEIKVRLQELYTQMEDHHDAVRIIIDEILELKAEYYAGGGIERLPMGIVKNEVTKPKRKTKN